MEAVTLGILAGGRGTRLGGRDKGLLINDGLPLVSQLASSSVGLQEVIVNCHGNPWSYQHYANRLVCDLQPEGGPVRGMATLIWACQSSLLAVLPCDQLAPPQGWIEHLLSQLGNAPGIFIEQGGHHSPCCLLRPRRLTQVAMETSNANLALRDWYQRLGITGAPYPDWPHDVDRWSDMAK